MQVFHGHMLSELQAKVEQLDLVKMKLTYRRHPAFAGFDRHLRQLYHP